MSFKRNIKELLFVVHVFLYAINVQAEEDEDYYYEEMPQNCSVSESITAGWVSYSSEGAIGSVLTYHCRTGYYPFPVSQRVCEDGEWSTMRLANGRRVSMATCKEIRCPGQLEFDNGQFSPRNQWFRPGEIQEFSCHDGFTLYGSMVRNCTILGDWTGTTPLCDDQLYEVFVPHSADDCRNPGTPPGALRSGHRFRVREKVQYSCLGGLDLVGSAERVCLDTLEWSGSETRCMAQFTFDSPEAVSQAMAGSLSGIMESSSDFDKKRKASFGRTIRVAEGRLNVYILLDTSGSINKESFEQARSATISLIQKLDSYEVEMRFHVVSYASQAKEIMSITDPLNHYADIVLENLRNFNYTAHGTKLGTNLYAALYNVYKSMSFLKENKGSKFNQTQNIILIITDGYVNTGKSPNEALLKIRALLGMTKNTIDNTDEDLLDIYVFGVGRNVNRKELDAVASKKRNEKHLFILEKHTDLGKVFDSMISDSGVTICGIAQETLKSNKEDYTRPWHVNVITKLKDNCKGSILTPNWILTASHCFTKDHEEHPYKVNIQHGSGWVRAASVIFHPKYNIHGLEHKNVREFYDYDIALVKVNQSIILSQKARPICLPCTKSSSRALKMNPNSTCQDHEKALLTLEETPALFLTKHSTNFGIENKETYIQLGKKRPDCIKHAATTFSSNNTATLEEFVTDRFMCTGGSQQYKDSLTCKGDSGGSLFLRKRQRYFQVGVVSWGTKNVCGQESKYSRDSPPEDARDFHISIFSVLPWLQQHLGKELEFLPANN